MRKWERYTEHEFSYFCSEDEGVTISIQAPLRPNLIKRLLFGPEIEVCAITVASSPGFFQIDRKGFKYLNDAFDHAEALFAEHSRESEKFDDVASSLR